MDSEAAANRADFFLRETPSAKISNNNEPFKRINFKEELQFLHLNDNAQERILDTLKYIHGSDFKLTDISAYEDLKSNFAKKYWVGQGNLVVKGGCDFSKPKDNAKQESELLKQFSLLRLESYGFHKNHCIEALEYCSGNIEDSLYLLFHKYYSSEGLTQPDHGLSETELLEHIIDEKSSLQSIYEHSFSEKITNSVWIFSFKLPFLVKIFHNKLEQKNKTTRNTQNKKEKCKNIARAGFCKYGDKCRFSHEVEKKEVNLNVHLEDFTFELEIRFPKNTKYPFEPPLIFLKTNAVLPHLVNLHICKRLHEEAKILAQDGIPCVYTLVELINNEEEIVSHLKSEVNFISPNRKLFEKEVVENNLKQPSHYTKGVTNRNNKKVATLEQILEEDKKIVKSFNELENDRRYLKMWRTRHKLPAYTLVNDILNEISRSQVVVISGETGCGKSTQVPQYILDNWLKNYNNNCQHIEIVCTQPRRISAIGVAERVADERIEKVGNTVGYQIRLETKTSSRTRLTFCTTGILLRRLESDPTLSNVSHIIVDEVHERSEESDFLLLILRDLLPLRKDLKVILMSATMNAGLFSNYFGSVPVIDIPGRTFPVAQYFLEDIFETVNYVLEEGSEYSKKLKFNSDVIDTELATCDVTCVEPKNNIKDENLSPAQVMGRYKDYSTKTCKNLFMSDPDKINYELIEAILVEIVSGNHEYPRTGTILIFLPGIAEITTLFDQLSEHPEFGRRSRKFLLLPLHSSLTSEEQAAIFRVPKNGERKIILSTNLAETSVTIDDCVFVIDCGKMKEKHFDPNRNMESLETVWVTRANALQRKGRAGRVMPGVCYHLYTNHRFKHHMLPQPVPEIHRIPLEQLVLKIKVMDHFDNREVSEVLGSFIEPPVKENVETAISRLQNVGALDHNNNLTALGHHLAALPVDVRIGKLMLYGAIFGCVDAALTIAACLSYKNPFVTPFGKKEEANKKKRAFAVGYSDQITVLMAYRKWLSIYKKSSLAGRNFANENFLSFKTLQTIADIKHQFLEFLVDIGFVSVNIEGKRRMGQDNVFSVTGSEFNKQDENIRLLSSILCTALYPNVVKILTPGKSYTMSAGGAVLKENNAKDLKFATMQEMVFMHPSSVNYPVSNFPSPFLVYQEKVRTSKVFFRDCSMVPVIPLVLFSGFDLDIKVRNGDTFITLEDGWIMFRVEEHKVAEMIKMIRYELYMLLEEKIRDPLLNLLHDARGEKIISTILNLISTS